MAQNDLSGPAGGGLSTHTGGDLLDFSARFQECFDMFIKVVAIAGRRLFLCFVCHNYSEFSVKFAKSR